MKTERFQDEDGNTSNPKKEVAPPTSDERGPCFMMRSPHLDRMSANGGLLVVGLAVKRPSGASSKGKAPMQLARDVTR